MAMHVDSGKNKKGRATPEMNVTPLVDVVLVLLIIFMVVTPLMMKQFWIHLPDQKEDNEPPPPSEQNDPPVVLTVMADGTVRINRTTVRDQELETRVRRVLAAKGERTLFFDAEDDSEFGRAMEIMDRARGGGATTIAVMTDAIPQSK
ncbi:MAG: ExbD/TolR family protein [Myxococcota bacterium]